jgi:hypothetical protein
MITCNCATIVFGHANCIIDWATDAIFDWLLFAVIIVVKKICSEAGTNARVSFGLSSFWKISYSSEFVLIVFKSCMIIFAASTLKF